MANGNGWFLLEFCTPKGNDLCGTIPGWGYVDLATGVEQDFLLPQWGGLDPASDGASVAVETGSDTGDPAYLQCDISLWQPGFTSYLKVSSGHHGDVYPQVAGDFVVFYRKDDGTLHLTNWRTGEDKNLGSSTQAYGLGKSLLIWVSAEGMKGLNLQTGQVFTLDKGGGNGDFAIQGDMAAWKWDTLEPPPSCWYHSELVTADSSGTVTRYESPDYIERVEVFGGRVAYTTKNRK